jgi:putative membrane protein
MSPRSKVLFRGAILGGLGLFLYSKISNGTLFFYIHYRFAWLTLLAAMLLLVLAAATMYDVTERTDTGEGESCGQEGHTHGVSRTALILLALPIVLGLVVPARPLGAEAVSQRQVNVAAVAPAQLGGRIQRVEDDNSILGWLRRFYQTPDPAAFVGKEADLVGFVFHDERLGEDQFMVARFAIYCCVADAVPVGIVVRWPEASSLDPDAWVRVQGRFELGEFDGEAIPILAAETVVPTQPPNQPYVYP